MKIILRNILLLILVITFGFKSKNKEFIDSLIQSDKELLFNSKIGPEELNTEVYVFKSNILEFKTKLLINLNRKDKIIFSDTLTIEMNEEPIIELRKINNDKVDDLAIEYLRPGRGGNNVSMIYLFDSENLCLKKISNSILFPNLIYDKNLNFISSFRFYGGDAVQINFLKIKNDSLLPKYNIIKEVRKVYLKKLEKNKWIDIGIKTLDNNDNIIPEIIELEPEIKIKNAS